MTIRTGRSRWFCVPLAVVLAYVLTPCPAPASTFVRLGLEELTTNSRSIVIAQVLNTHSYWSQDSSFILTDVTLLPIRTLKGRAETSPRTITVPGGTVGETTNLVVGSPALLPGRTYMLFLGDAALPGGHRAETVREYAQGVFDVVPGADGMRAVSQAVHHRVLGGPDGRTEPPGGRLGLRLDDMIQQVEALAKASARRER